MHLIRGPLPGGEVASVYLKVDRLTLEKCQWTGKAEDGVEFTFDLAAPLWHGARFADPEGKIYRVEQLPEKLLEVQLIPRLAPVARLGWSIGNLHFPIAVTEEVIHVPDDPALHHLLVREHIPFTVVEDVFQPFVHAHDHAA